MGFYLKNIIIAKHVVDCVLKKWTAISANCIYWETTL